MCGRFVASRPIEDLLEEFGVDDVRVEPELLPEPRFNISPQADVVAVREVERPADDGGELVRQRRLGIYRWGLVPSWAKDPSVGARSFNARAETLAEKPMFRTALAKRRCIVPADAFYEWQRLEPRSGAGGRAAGRSVPKQPWCFKRADGGVLGFAGLYEVWKARTARTELGPPGLVGAAAESSAWDGDWLLTCTIVTTTANELMSPIHDRMPVVLEPESYEAWLAPGALDQAELGRLSRPAPEEFLVAYEVGPEVGNSRAEGPELIEPLAAGAEAEGDSGAEATSGEEGRLF